MFSKPRVIDQAPPQKNPAGKVARRPAKQEAAAGGGAAASGQPGILKFYDQEAPGIKMCVRVHRGTHHARL